VGEGDRAKRGGGGTAPVPTVRKAGQRPLASPAVRNRARDLGIELQFVSGSGPAGRIDHADLDAFVAGGARPSGRASGAGDSRYVARDAVEDVKIIGLRRKIAEKMQEAKRRIPHFMYAEEVDVTELEALRVHLNATKRPDQPKLTLLPFILRALVKVLPQHPQINARYDDDNGVLHRYAGIHVGIATQTPNGLMVPVVRNAEARDPWDIALEISRVSGAAKNGSATRDELTGSTITVTSLGPLGGVVHTPVINHPEVAIVGPNKIIERPVVQNGQIVVRKMMNLSSSFDHRIVDGYDAAEFIQKVKALLEHPATLFID
jgi:2-oxoisovalerate dehydrogenase E2 component (dihydrolipoyl transacylase)